MDSKVFIKNHALVFAGLKKIKNSSGGLYEIS